MSTSHYAPLLGFPSCSRITLTIKKRKENCLRKVKFEDIDIEAFANMVWTYVIFFSFLKNLPHPQT